MQSGRFTGDAAGYPVTITAPGSYLLTSNLVVPDENTDAIAVSSSGISIDLSGFAIVRSGCEAAATTAPQPQGIRPG